MTIGQMLQKVQQQLIYYNELIQDKKLNLEYIIMHLEAGNLIEAEKFMDIDRALNDEIKLIEEGVL